MSGLDFGKDYCIKCDTEIDLKNNGNCAYCETCKKGIDCPKYNIDRDAREPSENQCNLCLLNNIAEKEFKRDYSDDTNYANDHDGSNE